MTFKIMIFSNLRHDNWWSRDNFLNQIKDDIIAIRSEKVAKVWTYGMSDRKQVLAMLCKQTKMINKRLKC
jgi:hypothetical protein